MLEIITLVLGPVETNTYIVADPATREAVVIDPAWEGEKIARRASQRGWTIRQLWLTHAHFDHLAGAAGIAKQVTPAPPIALHPLDFPLWSLNGGAAMFGMRVDPGPRPSIRLEAGQVLQIGVLSFEVRLVPGHTPGHVVFYSAAEKVLFCGDAVFAGSIGRTDLPGGDYQQLLESIRTQILSLPEDTRLLSGHGPASTVGQEKRTNPFLTDLLVR
jgi:glyoxylase-like metal-dependent hydrolase (beta-lactamase superfamily II)